MQKAGTSSILLILLSSFLLMGFRMEGEIDRKQLRSMLTQLGYEVTDISKEVGKEKYSVTFVKENLNIPVGYEISPSNSFIWLTVNLGTAPAEGSAKSLALLKQNAKIQPAFFYVTESGRLMAAMAIENRSVTNAVLRLRSDFLSDQVGKSKGSWQD